MKRVRIGNELWWSKVINGTECLSPTFKGLLETIKAYKELYNA